MRYIVLDTNCLLQALPSSSPFHKIWTEVLEGHICLCVNTDILEEYEEVLALKRILEKWIVACVKYFSMCNMDREIIYDEVDLTIRNYSFISIADRKKLINDILDKTLQKCK